MSTVPDDGRVVGRVLRKRKQMDVPAVEVDSMYAPPAPGTKKRKIIPAFIDEQTYGELASGTSSPPKRTTTKGREKTGTTLLTGEDDVASTAKAASKPRRKANGNSSQIDSEEKRLKRYTESAMTGFEA